MEPVFRSLTDQFVLDLDILPGEYVTSFWKARNSDLQYWFGDGGNNLAIPTCDSLHSACINSIVHYAAFQDQGIHCCIDRRNDALLFLGLGTLFIESLELESIKACHLLQVTNHTFICTDHDQYHLIGAAIYH